MIELQGSDEFVSFGPTCDCTRIDPPKSNDLVSATTCNAIVLGDVEDGAGDYILMSQHLNRSSFVKVPDDDFHVGAGSEKVVFIRLFWAPIDIKDVELMTVLEFLARLDLLTRTSCIE